MMHYVVGRGYVDDTKEPTDLQRIALSMRDDPDDVTCAAGRLLLAIADLHASRSCASCAARGGAGACDYVHQADALGHAYLVRQIA